MKRANRAFVLLSLLTLLVSCATDDPERQFMRPDGGSEQMDVASSDEGVTEDVGEPDASEAADASYHDRDEGTEDGGEGEDLSIADEDMADNGICRPNRDGLIERDELDFVVGASAKFMVAEEVTFDTAGTMEMDTRVWDLAQDFQGEYLDVLQFRDPTGEWWEPTFPTATYHTLLSASSDLFGVFEATDDALLLLGVVSPEDGFFRTEVEYDPPVPVLQFPLAEGETWSVESDVSGIYEGTIVAYDEVYDFEADAHGVLQTDFGNFDVLRVRSTLDKRVGLVTTIIRSFAFVTECFGTVATVSAHDDEDDVEFTDVAELKRIAP